MPTTEKSPERVTTFAAFSVLSTLFIGLIAIGISGIALSEMRNLQAQHLDLLQQVVVNTAKTGITQEQADAITANTDKTGITQEQAGAITANTDKTGITQEQADAITANTEKIGITQEQAGAITANTDKTGITQEQADAITDNTDKTGITQEQASAITANTEKTGITQAQADEIALNTDKTGITEDQADSITANTAKYGLTKAQAAQLIYSTKVYVDYKDDLLPDTGIQSNGYFEADVGYPYTLSPEITPNQIINVKLLDFYNEYSTDGNLGRKSTGGFPKSLQKSWTRPPEAYNIAQTEPAEGEQELNFVVGTVAVGAGSGWRTGYFEVEVAFEQGFEDKNPDMTVLPFNFHFGIVKQKRNGELKCGLRPTALRPKRDAATGASVCDSLATGTEAQTADAWFFVAGKNTPSLLGQGKDFQEIEQTVLKELDGSPRTGADSTSLMKGDRVGVLVDLDGGEGGIGGSVRFFVNGFECGEGFKSGVVGPVVLGVELPENARLLLHKGAATPAAMLPF